MIYGEQEIKIYFDEQDRSKIQGAMNVLDDIRTAFKKVGGQTSDEEEALAEAEHILYCVLSGETF